MNLVEEYKAVRQHTETICSPLQTEDYVVQPIADVSPPKWHLGHTTWFFETFLLKPYRKDYREFNPDYNFVFNSYYETVGARVIRTDRGNLSRPTVQEIFRYRRHVDQAMQEFLSDDPAPAIKDLVLLGFNHEQQHQELLYTDIKYILGHNPLFPAYSKQGLENNSAARAAPEGSRLSGNPGYLDVPEGVYQIGYTGKGFCFDNEREVHKVFLQSYKIAASLVTNAEYLEFIKDRGYTDFRHWHAEGWDWVRNKGANAPLYWHSIDGQWFTYTLSGLTALAPGQPVTHINFYEASAFAAWKGKRLPLETEWEVASPGIQWGSRWEWTESAYLPYPGFSKAEGAIGEYNGKFMVSQMVLRGASIATPPGHSRNTYRNFFHPHLQWQFTGIRLAQ